MGALWNHCTYAYRPCDLAQSRNNTHTGHRRPYAEKRSYQHTRGAAAASSGPGGTVGHHLATLNPPGAASGPPDVPNVVDLAAARSHAHKAPKWRARGGPAEAPAAAEGAVCAPCTHLTLPSAVRPTPTAATTVRRPLRPLRAARSRGGRAGRRAVAALRRYRDGAVVCANAANRARWVMGDVGARPGQRGGCGRRVTAA